jgi:hypothetical protein
MSPPDDVARLLAGARRAVGLRHPPREILAEAAVTGPARSFRTHVTSRSDGSAWLYQSPDLRLAILMEGQTPREPPGPYAPAAGDDQAWVRGHELHALALFPETRLASPVFLGPETFGSIPALAVRWRVTDAHSLVTFHSASDTLPLGVRMEWTDPVVEVVFGDWGGLEAGAFEGTRIFRTATFTQAGEIFRYRYDRVTLGTVPDPVLPGHPR